MDALLVCVVDDDDSVRESLSGLLRSVGHRVALFGSAEAYLEAGLFAQTGCLILDVGLPGMSGPDLQDALAGRSDRPPIVFMTARDHRPTRERALRSGAMDFLHKPFDDTELLTLVERGLARRRKEGST